MLVEVKGISARDIYKKIPPSKKKKAIDHDHKISDNFLAISSLKLVSDP
jgi:hypothetical protein